MPAIREVRSLSPSGHTARFVVIGMVITMIGASFAMLPVVNAQDEPTPTPERGSVTVAPPQSVSVNNEVRLCSRGVDRAAVARSGLRRDCDLSWEAVDDIQYSPIGESALGEPGYRPTGGSFAPGHLAVTVVVPQSWDAPRVFCSKKDLATGYWVAWNAEYFPIVAHASGSPTTAYTISLDNEVYHRVECLWLFAAEGVPAPEPWTRTLFDEVVADAYACPDDVARPGEDAGQDEYLLLRDTCNTPLGATFELLDANGAQRLNAGRDGQVIFTDVTTGEDVVVRLTELVPDGRGDPIVFCEGLAGSETRAYQRDDFGSITLAPHNLFEDSAGCTFFHFPGFVVLEPAIDITPPVERPGGGVTPVAPIQLPTSTPTPAMPQAKITPPAQIPEPVFTPVIQLPGPTPTAAPDPPIIVITPVIEYPIEIVTPIVPVIPIEPPELQGPIGRAPDRLLAAQA